ncbi:MAG: hypothetical protein IT445_00465 [Phycisphaeraceae bacterium]|nr:hypothetical protein [Phycisphaeraceae bacterium]
MNQQNDWTPRQRFRAALERKPADRAPLALWGSYYGITDGLYFQLLEVLGYERDEQWCIRPRHGRTVNYLDDRVMEALGIDVRYVWLGSTDINGPDFSNVPPDGEAEGTDRFGLHYLFHKGHIRTLTHITPIVIDDVESASPEVIERYQLPPAEQIVRLEPLKKRAAHLARKTPYAVIARAPNSYGLYEQSQQLMGPENVLMALLLNKPLMNALLDKLLNFFCDLYSLYMDAAGPYLDMVELPGDDYAGTAGPIISTELYDELFLPRYRKLVQLIKSKAPQAKVLLHSDGQVEKFLDRFAATGADVFHCVETGVGNDLNAIKHRFGDRLAFLGALDIKQAMRGSKDDVQRDIDTKMAALNKGGGFVLAPENHLQPDVPVENVLHAFAYAAKAGRM